MLKRFVSSALLIIAGAATAQENYGEWSFVKELTVNTTSGGINVAEDVAKYPLLVRLGSADAAIFSQAGANGASLRFTKPNGTTRLPHSVDHWDAVNKSAAIWVLADTVYGNSATGLSMRMYWGKVGAADSSSASAVFETTNGFLNVYHMGNGDETVARPNAVAGRNPATPMNLPAEYAPTMGAIGMADTLGETGGTRLAAEHFSFGPISATDMPTSHLTISLWLKASSGLNAYAHAITLAGAGEDKQNNIYIGKIDWKGGGNITFSAVADGNGDELGPTAPAWTHESWQLIHAVLDGGVRRIYNNGAQTGASAELALPAIMDRPNALIGATLWPDNSFAGAYDEVRVANVVRDSNWVKLDYSTQMPGATAVALGATDTLNPFVVISELRYQAGNTDAIDTLSYSAFSNVNVTPTYVGQTPDSFTVSGTLPAGVTFNEATGALTGTVTTTSSAALTFTAHVDAETATRTVRLIVTPGIANLRYVPTNTADRDTLYMMTGVAANIVPQYDGGPADSIKVTSNNTSLPAGITMNKTTGAITGTPTATFTGNRTVTAYFGNATTTRNIRFVVGLGPTTALAYNDNSIDVDAGESIDGIYPTWSGRNPTMFSVTPALPAGLAINPLTGVISGTPTAAKAEATYTVRATNATDTITVPVMIEVDASAADGAYATAWSRHATLTLNTSATGANVAGEVTKFPVLVRLGVADSAIFREADNNGDDIRFTKMNNTTRLPHQIDHWDDDAQSAAIWVLVDTVKANTASQGIRMHWGNAEADGMSNGNAVFDTANGFVAVWHLGGGDETDIRPNAVAGAHPAVPEFFAEDYQDRAGMIGRADTLSGGTQAAGARLSLGRGYGNWGGAMTMSMWIKPHAVDLSQWNQYISLSNGQAQDNIWMGRQGNNQNFTTELYSGTQSGGHTHAADVQVQGEWQLLSWTVTGGTEVVLYRNGAEVATRTSTQPLKDTLRTVNHIGRAAWPDPTIEAVVDEARLSKVARSANWMKLEFENQKTAQTLVSMEVDSIPTSLANVVLGGPALSFRALQGGVMFNIRTEKAANARIEILDMRGRTVWARSLRATSGVNEILWDGRSDRGAGAGSGVYFVRMKLLDADNKPTHTLDRKLPLSR